MTNVRPIIRELIHCAQRRETITYKALGNKVGRHQRALSAPLDQVIVECRELGLPNLDSLVVYATSGRCGPGYLATHPGHDEDVDRAECWAFFTAPTVSTRERDS